MKGRKLGEQRASQQEHELQGSSNMGTEKRGQGTSVKQLRGEEHGDVELLQS